MDSETQAGLNVHQLGIRRGDSMIISNLSFEAPRETALMVSGPNGVGKTSLLRSLAGLLTCETGHAMLGNDALEAHMLHYVGHREGLKSQLTVIENLNFLFDLLAEPNAKPPDIDALLHYIGLFNKRHQMVSDLSAGQKRRAAFSRLFMVPRRLWLLDEPYTALDRAGRDWLSGAVREHCKTGGIVIAASHEPLDFASQNLVLEVLV